MEVLFKLIEIKGEEMVLESKSDGEQVVWPKNYAPLGLSEGDSLSFLVSKEGSIEKSKQSQAKDILNEILNVE